MLSICVYKLKNTYLLQRKYVCDKIILIYYEDIEKMIIDKLSIFFPNLSIILSLNLVFSLLHLMIGLMLFIGISFKHIASFSYSFPLSLLRPDTVFKYITHTKKKTIRATISRFDQFKIKDLHSTNKNTRTIFYFFYIKSYKQTKNKK